VSLPAVGDRCEVLIEYPRWSMVKRRTNGSIDFVSPLPCPYNYGHVPGTMSEDGDMLDAVVLGARLPAGARVTTTVVGVIEFHDVGLFDPKVICSAQPMTAPQRRGLELFFTVYALGKRGLAAARGQTGATRYAGWIAR
jgi:inorganic pyrophosphatase